MTRIFPTFKDNVCDNCNIKCSGQLPGAESSLKNCVVFGPPLPGSFSVERNTARQAEKKAARKL